MTTNTYLQSRAASRLCRRLRSKEYETVAAHERTEVYTVQLSITNTH